MKSKYIRFNFQIQNSLAKYLQDYSDKTGQTKSKALVEILQNELSNIQNISHSHKQTESGFYNLRLPVELYNEVEEKALKLMVSKSDLVRECLAKPGRDLQKDKPTTQFSSIAPTSLDFERLFERLDIINLEQKRNLAGHFLSSGQTSKLTQLMEYMPKDNNYLLLEANLYRKQRNLPKAQQILDGIEENILSSEEKNIFRTQASVVAELSGDLKLALSYLDNNKHSLKRYSRIINLKAFNLDTAGINEYFRLSKILINRIKPGPVALGKMAMRRALTEFRIGFVDSALSQLVLAKRAIGDRNLLENFYLLELEGAILLQRKDFSGAHKLLWQAEILANSINVSPTKSKIWRQFARVLMGDIDGLAELKALKSFPKTKLHGWIAMLAYYQIMFLYMRSTEASRELDNMSKSPQTPLAIQKCCKRVLDTKQIQVFL